MTVDNKQWLQETKDKLAKFEAKYKEHETQLIQAEGDLKRVLRDLAEMGYKNVTEAKEAMKKLDKDIEDKKKEVDKTLADMEAMVDDD